MMNRLYTALPQFLQTLTTSNRPLKMSEQEAFPMYANPHPVVMPKLINNTVLTLRVPFEQTKGGLITSRITIETTI
jgi:hypothetical protein